MGEILHCHSVGAHAFFCVRIPRVMLCRNYGMRELDYGRAERLNEYPIQCWPFYLNRFLKTLSGLKFAALPPSFVRSTEEAQISMQSIHHYFMFFQLTCFHVLYLFQIWHQLNCPTKINMRHATWKWRADSKTGMRKDALCSVIFNREHFSLFSFLVSFESVFSCTFAINNKILTFQFVSAVDQEFV